jgi:hypothetical protein
VIHSAPRPAVCTMAGMPDNRKDPKSGEHQTDLAEGERSTVDESIRIHEKKRDEQGGQPAPKK